MHVRRFLLLLLRLLLRLLLGRLGSPPSLVGFVLAPLALLVCTLVGEDLLETVGELVGVKVAHNSGRLAGRARRRVGGAGAGEKVGGGAGRGPGHTGLHFGGLLFSGCGLGADSREVGGGVKW